MKRNLALCALALIFGFALSAVPAMAQIQFVVAGGNQIVRGEGHTETVNSVTLTYPGVVTTINAGTTINFDYDATVTNGPVGAASPPSNVTARLGGVLCAIGTCANLSEAVSGNRITLTIVANQAINPGDFVTLGSVRVDVAGLGTGVSVVHSTLSSSPPSANITYNPTSVNVALVVAPSIKVKFSATPLGVLTCNPATSPGPAPDPVTGFGPQTSNQFLITATETTQHAYTTLLEEQANTPATAASPTVTNGTQVVINITGVPSTLNVHFDGVFSASGATVTGPNPSSDVSSTGPGQVIVFTFPIASDTAGIDDLTFGFSLYLKGSNTLSLGPQTVKASVELGPVGTVASTPSTTPSLLFADLPISATVSGVSDCVTNLLFPWVVVDAPGGTFDTGIAVANTSKDVFPIGGATAQTGSCSFTGFDSVTGNAVALTPAIGPVAAGQTAALVLSTHSEFAAFRGYAIAVCGFQNGHAFAFITQNNMTPTGTSQGYIALVIPNPSLISRSPAGVGGAGEVLGH